MGHLFKASAWGDITKKVIIYSIPLFIVYFIYMFISNQMVFHNHNYPSIQLFCRSRSFRFFFRELEVYTFAYLGYRFVKKHLEISWSKLFLLGVFSLDFFVSCIGAYRYFVKDSGFLDILYNQLLVFIASPFYFLIFAIFAIYLRPGINLDSNDQKN
jgi:hypothetical protein